MAQSEARAKAAGELRSAQLAFLNNPHPLEILADPGSYGTEGSISRDHDPRHYTFALAAQARRVVREARREERQVRRAQHWLPLLQPPSPPRPGPSRSRATRRLGPPGVPTEQGIEEALLLAIATTAVGPGSEPTVAPRGLPALVPSLSVARFGAAARRGGRETEKEREKGVGKRTAKGTQELEAPSRRLRGTHREALAPGVGVPAWAGCGGRGGVYRWGARGRQARDPGGPGERRPAARGGCGRGQRSPRAQRRGGGGSWGVGGTRAARGSTCWACSSSWRRLLPRTRRSWLWSLRQGRVLYCTLLYCYSTVQRGYSATVLLTSCGGRAWGCQHLVAYSSTGPGLSGLLLVQERIKPHGLPLPPSCTYCGQTCKFT